MDQLAKNALNGYEANYQPTEWDRMETMLDRKGRLMPNLWAFKGAEILGLLLLLGGLQWFVFGVPGQTQAVAQSASDQTFNTQSSTTRSIAPAAMLTSSDETSDNSTPNNSTLGSNHERALPSEKGHVNIAPTVLPKDIPAQRRKEALRENRNNTFPFLDPTGYIAPAKEESQETPSYPLANNLPPDNESTGTAGTSFDLASLFMKNGELESSYPEHSTFEKLALKSSPPKKAEKRPAKTEWLVGTSFSPEFTHLVNTGSASVGLGAEVNATLMVSDKLGFETGLQYSLKRYFSKENRNTQIQNGSTLYTQEYQKVNMHTITVPLKVRVNVYQNRNMRLYASAGGSISGILSNEVTTEYKAKTVDAAGSELNVAGALNRNLPQDNGLLQGGNTSNNLFGSVNGAMGAEFKGFGKSWIYIQPYYMHSLNNAGPHGEKFGTYGLAIGARF